MSKNADSLAKRSGVVAVLGILSLAGWLSAMCLPSAHAVDPQKFPGAIPPATTLPRGTTPPVTSPNVPTVTPPDLVLTAVSNPPAIASPGVSFPVTDTTGNSSTTPTPATYTRYFLSTDLVVGNDVPLGGQRQVPMGLVSGAASTGTVNAAIPATVPPGAYYLLACADAAGAIPEANERNNCRFSTGQVTVGMPDLAEESVTTSETVWAPGYIYPIHIGYKTLNNSPIPTPQATYTKYWASTDFTIGNDVYLGERAVPAGLTSGRESFGTYEVKIPPNIPSGSYYLLACADAAGALPETNEGNNCRFGTQKITVGLSDLTMVAASIPPAVVTPGDNISVTDTVRNLTSIPPNNTIHTNYFLSADLTMGNDVKLTESRKVGNSLVAGADSTGTVSINIPSTLPLGAYYLLACVDTFWQDGSRGFVVESNENNNCLFAQAGIVVDRPDLLVTAVSTPAVSAPYGGKITVTETTHNAGKTPAKLKAAASGGGSTPGGHDTYQTPAPTSIRNWYYLSTDPSVGNDMYLGGRQVAAGLPGGASDTGTVVINVPGNTVLGTYYLIACTDSASGPGGDVVESNEGNNCAVAPRQLVIRNPQAGDVF